MGKLIVKVHGCRDLKGTDILSKADCYVKVTVGSKNFRTKTIDNDENPNYNEAFSFFLSDAAIDESIKFELFDAGTFSDDLLGNLYIPIRNLHPNQENSLTLKWEKAAGSLICKIHPELGDAASAQMTGSVANNHGSSAPLGGSIYPQVDNGYTGAPQQQHHQQHHHQQQPQQYMPTGGPFGSTGSLSNSSGTVPGSPYGAVNQTSQYANPYGSSNPYGNNSSNNYQQQPQPQQQQGAGYNYPQAGGFTNSAYSSVGHSGNNNSYGSSFQSTTSTANNNTATNNSSGYPGYAGGVGSYPGANSTGGSAYPGYPGYK